MIPLIFLTKWKCVCVYIQLCLTLCNPWTVAFQSLSMEFFRHGMNSNPSSGDLPDPGIKAMSSALQTDSSPLCHLGNIANENIFILSGLSGIYNFIYKPRVFKVTHLLKMILRKVQCHLLGLKSRVQRSFPSEQLFTSLSSLQHFLFSLSKLELAKESYICLPYWHMLLPRYTGLSEDKTILRTRKSGILHMFRLGLGLRTKSNFWYFYTN